MQLDNTRIAIRERSLTELFDLALHVTREFFGPILLLSLLVIVPLALLNFALVGWMLPGDLEEEPFGVRFVWNMLVLVYLEAPLASILVVAYLGPAVFLEKKTVREVLMDVLRALPPLFVCQFLLRGILPLWLLYFAVDRYQFSGFVEGFLLTCLVFYAMFIRAIRPYITEIILLERNPLWSRSANTITIGRRSGHLHGPYAADLIVRWFAGTLVALLLFGLMMLTLIVIKGALISDWPFYFQITPFEFTIDVDWFDYQVLLPVSMWAVVAFMAVARFLSYLDLRIRHEGWEVELLMRAEAMRLATHME